MTNKALSACFDSLLERANQCRTLVFHLSTKAEAQPREIESPPIGDADLLLDLLLA